MTEQTNQFDYARSLKNTLSQTAILRMAHNVMQQNTSRPEVVQEHISEIRKKLAEKKKSSFQNTRNSLAKLQETIQKTKSAIALIESKAAYND